jgi:putative transcriptional regulator
MFNKTLLLNKVINTLQKNEFEVFTTHGCFDVVARKKRLLLIKALFNIDALNEDHALSLRVISHFVSAYPFVVSIKNNREFLDNETIYSRFELPVLTPQLLDEVVTEEEILTVQSAKGKHTVEIDTSMLKERRKELNYTLEELSQLVNISKKALYEIENKRVNPQLETVKILERTLGTRLRLPFEFKTVSATYIKPKNEFQAKVSKEFNRIGIDNSSVCSANFEIVGKEKFSLITGLPQNNIKIKKDAQTIKKLSDIFSSIAVFITKKSAEKSVEGIPIVLESELPEINSSKELSKVIEEKQG